jgi:two-component system sensor histidine kinase KdpD
MNSRWKFRLSRAAAQIGMGCCGIGAVTAVCFPLHLDFAVVGCLYLLVVVLQSAYASFACCALVSVIAVASLDFFFVPPLLSLEIDRPAYALALITYLVTALVITRLASKARQAAAHAADRREDLARLYELASQLVSVPPEAAVRREYLEIFRQTFELRAVYLFDGAAGEGSYEGTPEHNLAALARDAYFSGRDHMDREEQIAVRCLRVYGKAIGAVGFEGLRDAGSTAGPLSMLVTAMLQRASDFQRSSEAAAAAQVEELRSAVLDAFAHQFKTPLAAIITSAGSLRETGPLLDRQLEMVKAIESQTAGLGRLTTRLLRMARLDREEIRPRMETTDLCALVSHIAEQCRNQFCDRQLLLDTPEDPVEVLSDPEMLGLAVIQLVDNAFRYSPLDSTIEVAVNSQGGSACIRVMNDGKPIALEERSRIFDRFYRGHARDRVPGTGLGLYIARRIALAHGGTLDLDHEYPYPGITFVLKLPAVRDSCEHELNTTQNFGRR